MYIHRLDYIPDHHMLIPHVYLATVPHMQHKMKTFLASYFQ